MAGPVVTPTWPGYCGICRFITPGAWAATARGGQLEPQPGGLPGVGAAPHAAVVERGDARWWTPTRRCSRTGGPGTG